MLVIKGFSPQNAPEVNREILDAAREVAGQRLAAGWWPRLYFGLGGTGQPMVKVYEDEVKAGAVPMTFWEEEFYLEPYELGCVSWNYTESGRSREGTEELKEVLGKEFVFETVKPLKLINKEIIQRRRRAPQTPPVCECGEERADIRPPFFVDTPPPPQYPLRAVLPFSREP